MKLTKTVILAAAALTTATLLTAQAQAHKPGRLMNLDLSDLNGDGVISADEIRQARENSRAQMLSQFDADGNGELSRTERKALSLIHISEPTRPY